MAANKGFIKTVILISIVVALGALPVIFLKDAEFLGVDNEAGKIITEINPGYEPWADPLLKPKSGEIESLIFSIQAAIGSGVIFYGLGYMKGKKTNKEASK